MLVVKPLGKSKHKLAFRLQKIPTKNELLVERNVEEESKDLSYVDLFLALSYVDNQNSMDIRNLLRTLLYAISQRFSNEEVTELLSIGVDKNFKDSNFMDMHGSSTENSNYIDMILELLGNNAVFASTVHSKGLFLDEEDINSSFFEPLKSKMVEADKVKYEEPSSASVKPSGENIEKIEAGEKQPLSTVTDRQQIEEIKKNINDIDTSPLTKAFLNSMLELGSLENSEIKEEDRNTYLKTMLGGIAIVVPTITEQEIEDMTKTLREYMDRRAERIIQMQIDYFERGEE